MTMRTYPQAIAYAKGQRDNPSDYVQQQGHCQMFARLCVGADVWGDPSPILGYRTAMTAWHAIPDKYKAPGKVVGGGLGYFDDPNRNDMAETGHAIYFADWAGNAFSTDIARPGHVDLVHYSLITRKWGMRFLGSIIWTPSGAINLAPKPKPVPPKPPAPAQTYRQNKQVYSSKMRLGQMNSDSVWNVNLALYQKHYIATLADDYTPALKTAVAKFQHDQGWTGSQADGIVGPMTTSRLGLVWVTG